MARPTTTALTFMSGSSGIVTPTVIVTQPYQTKNGADQIIQTPPIIDTSGGQTNTPDIQRMIVRTSNMSMVVSDIAATLDRISTLAENSGGYIVSSNKYQDNGRLAGTITIRVPAGQFDSAMSTLRGMADEVTSENTSSQDVTSEYVDLTSQLKNLQATEAQLLQIMTKADKIADILAVQEQLTNTEGQIETTKGRMQYLEQTSATSLITVSLSQSKLDVKLTAMSGRNVRGGQNVYFSANVSGGFSPYNYKWDFGDKSTSTDESPVHVYNSSGKYTVSLIVTDDKGNTATDTRTDYITVQSGWNVGNVVNTAWKGLSGFFHGLVNVLIWLGIFSPIWIIVGAIVWWVLRKRKIRNIKKVQ
jgi:chitodextrinase